MKFSQRSEAGVRLMVDLAHHYGAGPVSLAEVARNEGLSQTFLEQVIMPLRKAGLVQSHQGVRGGYELSRTPEEIRMGDVLRVLEGSLAPMFCVTDTPDRDICALEEHCGTRILWSRVREGINMALDATSLADLLGADDGVPAEGRVAPISMPLPLPVVELSAISRQPSARDG
jgi:Rrf2 family protein